MSDIQVCRYKHNCKSDLHTTRLVSIHCVFFVQLNWKITLLGEGPKSFDLDSKSIEIHSGTSLEYETIMKVCLTKHSSVGKMKLLPRTMHNSSLIFPISSNNQMNAYENISPSNTLHFRKVASLSYEGTNTKDGFSQSLSENRIFNQSLKRASKYVMQILFLHTKGQHSDLREPMTSRVSGTWQHWDQKTSLLEMGKQSFMQFTGADYTRREKTRTSAYSNLWVLVRYLNWQ